jgi:ubiquinone/menaquinone biosynthesis C-methylase UbiE
MIPIAHLIKMKQEADEKAKARVKAALGFGPEVAAGGPPGSDASHPYGDSHQGARVLVSLFAALALAGALIASSWGRASRSTLEQSVAPGINREWKSDNIAPLVDRLEAESREIYHERAQLAALVGLKEGMEVADVGAGSGFMVEEFSRMVGSKGKVYAVDINPGLLGRIAQRAHQAGLTNIKTVLTSERTVDLPRRSVDVVFVCDTYHHFEYPNGSLAGIRRGLRARGELVVVEFHREAGKSPDFVMQHVRANKETFKKEIEAAGFRFVREEEAPFLKENYVLRFRKRGE